MEDLKGRRSESLAVSKLKEVGVVEMVEADDKLLLMLMFVVR
jgi:hypothetical protein